MFSGCRGAASGGQGENIAIGAAILVPLVLYAPVFLESFSGRHISGWVLSELHINYAGGFVRRGLLGEAAYQVQGTIGLPTKAFFGVVFAAGTLAWLGLLIPLVWPLRGRPALLCSIVLSPAFLLFPAYTARAAYMRKELFVCIGFAAHAALLQAARRSLVNDRGYCLALATVIGPYLAVVTLIHEMQWFFLPLHMWLVAVAVPRRWKSRAAVALFPALLTGVVVTAHPGNERVATAICRSWEGRAQVKCADSAIGAIGWSWVDSAPPSAEITRSPRSMLVWILCAALTAVPIVMLGISLRQHGVLTRHRFDGLLLAILPALLLFLSGRDGGRWVHVTAAAAVTALLAVTPQRLAAPMRSSVWTRPVVAVGLVLYLGAWRLPHAGMQTTVQGAFPSAFERAVRLQIRILSKVTGIPSNRTTPLSRESE